MPNKAPPSNSEATRFTSGERAVECGRKGGLATARKNKLKKTLREVMNDLMDKGAYDVGKLGTVAQQFGLTEDQTVKELMAVVCTFNTIRNGSFADLEKLERLMGEDKSNEQSDVLQKLDEVIGEIDDIAHK